MNIGFIYCFTNRYMPGICKLGMTDRAPSQRLKELSAATAVPDEFDIEFYLEVDNALRVEREMHLAFSHARVNSQREFFRCAPAEVYYWTQCNLEAFTEFVGGDVLFESSKLIDAAIAANGGVLIVADSEVNF